MINLIWVMALVSARYVMLGSDVVVDEDVIISLRVERAVEKVVKRVLLLSCCCGEKNDRSNSIWANNAV